MKLSTTLLTAILCLSALDSATSQVTNFTVNGSTTNFTMTSGDAIDWSYTLPVGAMAECYIWIDVNGNHAVDPGTDRSLFVFSQTDGDTNGNGGPPDIDGLANGAIHFTQAVGLAPATYVMEFLHNSVGQTIWGVVDPLTSPPFSVSGTVSGPLGVDLSYLVIEAQRDNDDGGIFWDALTDSLGAYTIEMNDTTGNPWRIRINQSPYPYTASPQDTPVTIDGDLTGVNFTLQGSAAQVLGRLLTDTGDSLGFTSVYISRMDTNFSNVSHYTETDASGRFWFGIPLGELNAQQWRIGQGNNSQPITTHMAASAIVPALSDGDSVVQDLIAHSVNSTIQGFVQLDGSPPGFPVTLYATNQDSGESYFTADSVTGSFSIPVSDQIWEYNLWPNNPFGTYLWPNVTAHPGDVGVIYNITTNGVGEIDGPLPSGYYLGQNYPNPFNPLTTITYGVPALSPILLTVYDMLGREVATLVNEVQDPGMKTVVFDAITLPSGVYTYRIVSSTFTDSRKMLVIK